MKIPKSLDELKKMVSEVDVNEAVGKVKATLETAGEVVKSVAQDVASKVEEQVEKIKHKGDAADKKDKEG